MCETMPPLTHTMDSQMNSMNITTTIEEYGDGDGDHGDEDDGEQDEG